MTCKPCIWSFFWKHHPLILGAPWPQQSVSSDVECVCLMWCTCAGLSKKKCDASLNLFHLYTIAHALRNAKMYNKSFFKCVLIGLCEGQLFWIMAWFTFWDQNNYETDLNGFLKSKQHVLWYIGYCIIYLKGKKEKMCWVDLCIHIAHQVPVLCPDNKPSLFHLTSQCALLFGSICIWFEHLASVLKPWKEITESTWNFCVGLGVTINITIFECSTM